MAPTKLTDYERQRLDNIRRNEEMMAALKVRSKATELSAASAKRPRDGSKSYRANAEKKPKSETPVVIRRSLRTRGKAPDSKAPEDEGDVVDPTAETSKPLKKSSPRDLGPISMEDAYEGEGSARMLFEAFKGTLDKTQLSVKNEEEIDGDGDFKSSVKTEEEIDGDGNFKSSVKTEEEIDGDGDFKSSMKTEEEIDGDGDFKSSVKTEEEIDGDGDFKSSVKTEEEIDGDGDFKSSAKGNDDKGGAWNDDVVGSDSKNKIGDRLKLASLTLKPENVARVVPGRIMAVKFFPWAEKRMIVTGNKSGNIGFWNVDSGEEEANGIYLYRPHPGPISGISIPRCSSSKMFTSCYDGFIRLMDTEKEVFDLVYSSDDTIYSLSQRPDCVKCLYFGEGKGGLNIWDERSGKFAAQWILHDSRINTIDFNVQNPNIMSTSSTDGTACIWDLRCVDADKPRSLATVSHKRAVHSAFFSPSGKYLATTSLDDNVGILGGTNFEDSSMIHHNNQTGRWISTFRAIWGWDDSYIFVGNMKRGVDVISPTRRRVIWPLTSSEMSAIPCRFDIHPYIVGTLAGATSGGQIYMWTSD